MVHDPWRGYWTSSALRRHLDEEKSVGDLFYAVVDGADDGNALTGAPPLNEPLADEVGRQYPRNWDDDQRHGDAGARDIVAKDAAGARRFGQEPQRLVGSSCDRNQCKAVIARGTQISSPVMK